MNNMWILNLIVCVFCFTASAICFAAGSTICTALEVVDILFGIVTGIYALRGFRNS